MFEMCDWQAFDGEIFLIKKLRYDIYTQKISVIKAKKLLLCTKFIKLDKP